MMGGGGSTPVLLALAMRVVRTAGRLVPTALRADWEREWGAELWHLYHSLEAQGRLSVYERAAFVLRSVGSVIDALQLRLGDGQLWRESFSAVAIRWGQHPRSVATALLFLSLGIAADALLIASGHVMVEDPRSLWRSVPGETRFLILGLAITCGVSLIVASAAAAAQLLGSADRFPHGQNRAWLAETLLVAGVTGWVGHWLAALGMRSASSPQFGEWLASTDLGAVMTSAWVASWLCGLTALIILHVRRRRRTAAFLA
jgi:hypothetical protein